MPSILVIVVTYNAEKWIENCLNSTINSTIENRVMVIDNCSTDGTVDIVEKNYPAVLLIRNASNFGFGEGNNIGIKNALENNYNYVALLNQDAKLEKDCLGKLINYSKQYPEFGILAPLTFSYDGEELDPFHLGKSFTNNLKLASDVYFKREEDVYEIDLAPAAMWLVKADAIRDIGGFDPLFFMYGEDNDLWKRCQYRGWKTGIFPKAIAYHHHNPDDWKKPQKRIWLAYSEIVLQLKNPGTKFISTFLKLEVRNALSLLYSLLTFNIFNAKILWCSNIKVLGNTSKIYDHRKKSLHQKQPFL